MLTNTYFRALTVIRPLKHLLSATLSVAVRQRVQQRTHLLLFMLIALPAIPCLFLEMLFMASTSMFIFGEINVEFFHLKAHDPIFLKVL
jgi:hypothetical protein